MLELQSVDFVEKGMDIGGSVIHNLMFSARIVDIERAGKDPLERTVLAPRYSNSSERNDHTLKFFNPEREFGKDDFSILTTYPFGKTAIMRVVHKAEEDDMNMKNPTAGELMYVIAQGYRKIYQDHLDEAQVWGHGIEDLFLEGAEIWDSGIITLSMGS